MANFSERDAYVSRYEHESTVDALVDIIRRYREREQLWQEQYESLLNEYLSKDSEES